MYLPSINTPDGLRSPSSSREATSSDDHRSLFEARLAELNRRLERAEALLRETEEVPRQE